MKVAILGASYLQRPLVERAKELGHTTSVFAWREGSVVDDIADHYYPVSILDKEEILRICREMEIDGIVTIATDIAMMSVNYVAAELGLIGNSVASTLISTDKFEMRKALQAADIPCPRFYFFERPDFDGQRHIIDFPVIVKPTDRSGSRGVTKVERSEQVNDAISKALTESIQGRVILEEFIEGREFSVETISYRGKHIPLAITDKETTGAPYFVETAHHQPADISREVEEKIFTATLQTLDVLGIENGAGHTEVFLTDNGEVRVVEAAGRMGGEFIGSHMVRLSTGYDFIGNVIKVALGQEPDPAPGHYKAFSGVYYVLPEPGRISRIEDRGEQYPEVVETVRIKGVGEIAPVLLDGAGKRSGLFVYRSDHRWRIDDPGSILSFVTE
ncbi:MAG: ATP-grasp domain-containing protein [Flavobacteriales bacterium]|nr:ATP-grasp domain-containing protein [Flavobacteriales bacterium]